MTTEEPSTAERQYLALQRQARHMARPTDEFFQLYGLEGLLARLAVSPYRDQLVLKGGMLLAAFDTRRPTRDIDLQAQQLANDADAVRDMVVAIAGVDLDDGLDYDLDNAVGHVIREDDHYSGIRVALDARLARAKLRLKVDVNVGDPIRPGPQEVTLDRLLGTEPIAVRGYPLAMVYAEKIVTALQRGTANTRWRDFTDLYLLTSAHDQHTQPAPTTSTPSRCAPPSRPSRPTGMPGCSRSRRCCVATPRAPSPAGRPGAESSAWMTGSPPRSRICSRPFFALLTPSWPIPGSKQPGARNIANGDEQPPRDDRLGCQRITTGPASRSSPVPRRLT